MPVVTVRYFAVLREQKGRESEVLEVPEGTTLAALYRQLFPPDARGVLPVAFARNQVYAEPSDVVEDGDELAFLPPLGGG